MTCIGALGLAIAPSAWWIFGARTVTGIGAAAWVAFTAYFAAYYSTGTELKRAISLINFVQGAAMVLATYSGGLIAQRMGYGSTFYGAAILAFVAFILLLFAGQPVIKKLDAVSFSRLKSSVMYAPLLVVSLMGVLSQFANWTGLFGFVPVYAAGIGATSADLGIINMVSLAASALRQRHPEWPRRSRRAAAGAGRSDNPGPLGRSASPPPSRPPAACPARRRRGF